MPNHIRIRPWVRSFVNNDIVNIDIYVSKEFVDSLTENLSNIIKTYNEIKNSHDYIDTCASYNQYNEKLEALSKKEKMLKEILSGIEDHK